MRGVWKVRDDATVGESQAADFLSSSESLLTNRSCLPRTVPLSALIPENSVIMVCSQAHL